MLTIALHTIREASRRRILLALGVVTLLVIGLTAWGFASIYHAERSRPLAELHFLVSQQMVLVLFVYSGMLALAAIFAAAPAIAQEVESGAALAVLARPLRRSSYYFGRWLGLAAIVSLFAAATTGIELVLVVRITGFTPPAPLTTILYMIAEALSLLTLALALSTRWTTVAAGVVSAAAFFASWMGGVIASIGQAASDNTLVRIGTGVRLLIPSDGLWHGAIFSLQTPSVLATAKLLPQITADPFFATTGLPSAFLVWSLAWFAAVFVIGLLAFSRRPL